MNCYEGRLYQQKVCGGDQMIKLVLEENEKFSSVRWVKGKIIICPEKSNA